LNYPTKPGKEVDKKESSQANKTKPSKQMKDKAKGRWKGKRKRHGEPSK
jgi:hypothetical protein